MRLKFSVNLACRLLLSGNISLMMSCMFQSNLLASGAGDSEIYIWDLHKTESPMTPGQKSQVWL